MVRVLLRKRSTSGNARSRCANLDLRARSQRSIASGYMRGTTVPSTCHATADKASVAIVMTLSTAIACRATKSAPAYSTIYCAIARLAQLDGLAVHGDALGAHLARIILM